MRRYAATWGFNLVPDPAEEKHKSIYERAPTEIEGENFSVAAAGEEDYMRRIADDVYYGERELYMSLGQFRAHVAHYLGEKRLRLRPEEIKVRVD